MPSLEFTWVYVFGWNMKFAHIIIFYLTRVTFQVFLAYHTEHCNSWPMRSWRKATVNILEHQSTRSWWILSARVCIVDCIRVKAHKFNRVSKQETLDLNPWQTKHVKCFYSDHVNSLGWMIEVLSFTGTKLFSQLPSPPRRIDKNQPFAPPPKIDWHLTSPYNITSESHMEVMRIEEIFSHRKSSWLFKKFSLLVSLEMYREQYGEYGYWC